VAGGVTVEEKLERIQENLKNNSGKPGKNS
jgi:hypothetical protein